MKCFNLTIGLIFIITTIAQTQTHMVYVPGGKYSTKQYQGVRKDTIIEVNAFYMDVNEVTVQQFEDFVNATGYVTKAERDGYSIVSGGMKTQGVNWRCDENGKQRLRHEYKKYPVVYITWQDANAYAKWKKKRLPTETEWEYAFREAKNSKYRYAGSNIMQKVAWNSDTPGVIGIMKVRGKFPNKLKIYDLSGNVAEMCMDRYDCTGCSKPLFVRVAKGGSYLDDVKKMGYDSRIPCGDHHVFYMGFRCVKTK